MDFEPYKYLHYYYKKFLNHDFFCVSGKKYKLEFNTNASRRSEMVKVALSMLSFVIPTEARFKRNFNLYLIHVSEILSLILNKDNISIFPIEIYNILSSMLTFEECLQLYEHEIYNMEDENNNDKLHEYLYSMLLFLTTHFELFLVYSMNTIQIVDLNIGMKNALDSEYFGSDSIITCFVKTKHFKCKTFEQFMHYIIRNSKGNTSNDNWKRTATILTYYYYFHKLDLSEPLKLYNSNIKSQYYIESIHPFYFAKNQTMPFIIPFYIIPVEFATVEDYINYNIKKDSQSN
jgi:hypothetical protein